MGLVATGWAEPVSRCVQHSLTGALAELGSRWQLSHSEASLPAGSRSSAIPCFGTLIEAGVGMCDPEEGHEAEDVALWDSGAVHTET